MKNGNEKEILDALNLIKNICVTNGSSCKDCPFSFPSTCRCIIHEVLPEDWKITDKTPSVWRAFSD